MLRSRLSLFITLVMLLSALLSTEATEVLLRVAVGATAADDDDGPYFTCPHLNQRMRDADDAHTKTARVGARISSSASSDCVVDEPTFSLPQLGAVVLPSLRPRAPVPMLVVAHDAETRGPPARPGRFVRPPPRAPPVS